MGMIHQPFRLGKYHWTGSPARACVQPDLDVKRPMQIALEHPDQPDIVALIAALDAYQAGLYPEESNHFVDIQALAEPHVLFAVARDSRGEATGCGAVVVSGQYGEIKRMYVRPDRRGQGISKALLAFLEQQAGACQCSELRLETGISQPEALGLYERAGFVRCGPFGDYADDPLSVFMRKLLVPVDD